MSLHANSVVAVRYGELPTTRSDVYLNYVDYGEPDGPDSLSYYFWVVRGATTTVVLDTGFSAEVGARRGRTLLIDPVRAFDALDVSDDADTVVVLSHAHYDHIGNLGRFRHATFVIAREEYDYWVADPHPLATTHRDVEPSEIAELAVSWRDRGVTGFDIAGAEAGFPPSRFAGTFTWLAALHLPVTVHAGEGDGLDSVRSALVDGRALRLGHGVRLAEDISVEYGGVDEDGEQLDELTGLVDLGETAAWVRDRQIALEVCPSSNLQTGAVDAAAGIAGHPIDLLVQLGFRVTVNTDNRLVSDVSLTDELYLLAETFGYSLSELLDLQLNAAEAAFLSVDEREDLAEILVAGWGEVISGDAVGPVLEELDDEDEDD